MTKKITQTQKIRDYAAKRPNATIADISRSMGIRYQTVYQVLKIKPKTPKVQKQKWKTVSLSTSKDQAMPFKEEAIRIFELTKGRQRMHPVTGKMLMQGSPVVEDKVTMVEPPADNVNHPAHYKVGGVETIDFIDAKGFGYNIGNVVKYLARADHKGNKAEDLKKARWYLNREISKLDGAEV